MQPRRMRRTLADSALAPHVLNSTSVSQSSAFALVDTTDRTQGAPSTAWYAAAIVGYLDQIAGGATTVTFALCTDAGGDEAFTPNYTGTIVVGRTTATDGSVSVAIDCSFVFPANTSYYVLAKTDAGSADIRWELHFAPGG